MIEAPALSNVESHVVAGGGIGGDELFGFHI